MDGVMDTWNVKQNNFTGIFPANFFCPYYNFYPAHIIKSKIRTNSHQKMWSGSISGRWEADGFKLIHHITPEGRGSCASWNYRRTAVLSAHSSWEQGEGALEPQACSISWNSWAACLFLSLAFSRMGHRVLCPQQMMSPCWLGLQWQSSIL